MRWGVLLLAAVQLGCLDAPPGSTPPPPGDVCHMFTPWSEPGPIPGLEEVFGVAATVDADADLILFATIAADKDIAAVVRVGEQYELADPALVEALNSTAIERSPTLSADGLTVWFTRGDTDEPVLYASVRDRGGTFAAPEPVTGLGTFAEGPEIWDQTDTMLYSVAGVDGLDLLAARCTERTRCTPDGPVAGLTEEPDPVDAAMRSDGLEIIYFSANSLVSATRASADQPFTRDGPLDFFGHDPDLTGDGTALFTEFDGEIHISTRSCLD